MSAFPRLKSGAVAQYPTDRLMRYDAWIGEFVDGHEQRYREASSPSKEWSLKLTNLNEVEAAAVRQLWWDVNGPTGTFSFVDPFDGTLHESCRFDQDAFEVEWVFENQAQCLVKITEVRD